MASTSGNRRSGGERDKDYEDRRERNRAAVKKCREKQRDNETKSKARVSELREANSYLEGKIEQQKETKKFLQELVVMQCQKTQRSLTPKEMEMLRFDRSS